MACGYALGISGTALSEAQNYIHINDFWVGLIGAGSLPGLMGSAIIGRIADRIGRRKMLMIDMYVFSLFSLLQLLKINQLALFLICFFIGLMIAIDYTVGNSLLVEWLPLNESGKKQSQLIIYWNIGFIFSYIAGITIHGFGSRNWQIILASSAILGLVIAVFRSVAKLPASPSWLASQGKHKKAQKLIQKHIGKKWGLPSKFLKAILKNRKSRNFDCH